MTKPKNGGRTMWQQFAAAIVLTAFGAMLGFTVNTFVRGQDRSLAEVTQRVDRVEALVIKIKTIQEEALVSRGERFARIETSVTALQGEGVQLRSALSTEIRDIKDALRRLEEKIDRRK